MDTTNSARPVMTQESGPGKDTAPLALERILVALDASEQANRALEEAIRLNSGDAAVITGIHAYAAKLHDRRFRQMEGGLPERYLEEEEMGYQRAVHDDLISRGLGIISDSYHDVAEAACTNAQRRYRRLSPEGKNYRQVVAAAESGDFDLLALGALGLGAVPGALVGTVCERVVRRSPIDTLVIRDPAKAIGDGPIVVGLDGSPLSFGALKTAFVLGRRLGAPVHAVAAYDPYYHYVAFNKIAGVLSEEAGEVFRFKEQEKLHEELIDEGIAKIYQSHLEVARRSAEAEEVALVCELLDGKPYRAILGYLEKVGASLLVLGKTGIHADPALDIGGNAENLLRLAPCHLWLGQTTHTPPEDVVAEETMSWSNEAEAVLARAPEFARGMARKAVIRFATERGHTFITADIVEEVADKLMPGRQASQAPAGPALAWSDEAEQLLASLSAPALAATIRLRAEKHARRLRAARIEAAHVAKFLDRDGAPALSWAAAALARLTRVPEAMRGATRARIEALARERGAAEVTIEIVEAGLVEARRAMEAAIEGGAHGASADATAEPAGQESAGGCPFAALHPGEEADEAGAGNAGAGESAALEWTREAEERMANIPEGFMRALTRQRLEVFARRHGLGVVTPEVVDEKYAEWAEGSARQKTTMKWRETALARVDGIPDFVRGMVILEVERCAREIGSEIVDDEVIDRASQTWRASGVFHSGTNPKLYR